MNAHTRKTMAAIAGHPAPRDLEWTTFRTMWADIADEVEQESGDRLAVKMNGHREVFHRQHDGRVSIGDIEHARQLLADHPELKGSGTLFVVAMDSEIARILHFDLETTGVSDTEHDVRNHDPVARHLRTVERHTGHDDHQVYLRYFDDLAVALLEEIGPQTFVLLGHGTGKSDVAEDFLLRLKEKNHALADRVAGVGVIDLSAADDAAIEAAAQKIVRQAR
ncbi:hypothetical protein ACFU44_15830 [Nocardia rhizosphaerihabitans]|uniref:hypothetical protein n=1 Tax=Nocardia rhizosphaerihabitans TaxID=1691570 RepID=UPI00366F93A8